MRVGRLLRRRPDEDLVTWLRKAAFRGQVAARNRWRSARFRRWGPRPTTPGGLVSMLGEASGETMIATYLSRRPVFLAAFGVPSPSRLEALRDEEPAWTAAVIGEAEDLMHGRYRLFGEAYDLGPEPDWVRDPIDGHRWTGFGPGLDVIRLGAPGEVRVLWELNRGHHLVRLAQARLLTGEPRFADRALRLVEHWIRSNPYEEGPNWHCAMEVALRAVNWIWLYHLLLHAGALTRERLLLLLPALWDHGRFVAANLEGQPGLRNSNHYLADGLGLFYLGRFFGPASEAQRWTTLGAEVLWKELPRQVLPDGVLHEMTTGYHRLVTEIYLHAWLLVRGTAEAPPADAEKRLRGMLDFTAHYLRPDGTAPVWGDHDDARVVSFSSAPPADHGHLLQARRTLFGGGSPPPSSAGRFEAAWLAGERQTDESSESPGSRAFPDAGVYVLRGPDAHVFFDAGPYGAHGHADALSFELFAAGRPLLVDSGTFTYTRSLKLRDAFRGTAAHNTVTLEGQDSSLLEANCLWGSRRGARVTGCRFEADPSRDVVEARHDGYLTLPQQAIHRRRLTLEKDRGLLVVNDEIQGRGEAEVAVYFHLAPGLQADIAGGLVAVRPRDGGQTLLEVAARAAGLQGRVEASEVSDRFASRTPALVLRFQGSVRLPLKAEFELRFGPSVRPRSSEASDFAGSTPRVLP